MTTLKNSVIAKIKKQGKNFEILVDCDNAMAFRKGESDFSNVLVTDEIFEDAKKGLKVKEKDIEEAFDMIDKKKVAEVIVKTGHISLTADYLRKEMDIKRRQVINLIVINTIDPQSGRPHPPQRIETALKDAKVKMDEHRSAEAQMQEIVKKINSILPIKIEVRTLLLNIPSSYVGKAHGILRKYGKVLKEEWDNDGSLNVKLELPAGMQEGFEIALNEFTHGDIDMKIIGRE